MFTILKYLKSSVLPLLNKFQHTRPPMTQCYNAIYCIYITGIQSQLRDHTQHVYAYI